MTNVALIPARAGSKRLAHKNTRLLGGKPLIVWTIEAAVESGCYDRVIICTDCDAVADLVLELPGRELMFREPVRDSQPDLEWVCEVFDLVEKPGFELLNTVPGTFSILRPTSPFRDAETIRQAWKRWEEVLDTVDSLRAVRKVSEHPGKMWVAQDGQAVPYDACVGDGLAAGIVLERQRHNQPTQSLEPVYVQTAGLEIAHTRNLPHSISGTRIAPYILEGPAALDINCLQDWWVAERYIAEAGHGLEPGHWQTLGVELEEAIKQARLYAVPSSLQILLDVAMGHYRAAVTKGGETRKSPHL